ncbi:MAG: flagellar type III secretion system protein FliR [Alphaproteobacteria bacterium]|jgi:flagellar biosynthetic protein FliR|nr:flagellar type III secretion system protein FliR [Alphaproteobacteria bacterium]
MLGSLLSTELFAFLLVFTRLSSAIMVMPGIGDGFVSPRIRLLLAMTIAVLVTPTLADDLPGLPESPVAVFVLLAGEIVIGLAIGLIARLLMTAVDVAGQIISFNLSLANAFVFNPAMAAQGSLPGAFLTILALVLIFATDLHHLMLRAAADSYGVFPPGQLPPMGDMADMVSTIIARSFAIGLQMAAPFVAVGLIFYLGLGVLSRLMPQMQVFFVAIPAQIMVGFVMMALTLSAAMLFWLEHFQSSLIGILAP